jgi:hypothetical protein
MRLHLKRFFRLSSSFKNGSNIITLKAFPRSSLEVIVILQQGILVQTTFQPFLSTCDPPLGLLSCINGKKNLVDF